VKYETKKRNKSLATKSFGNSCSVASSVNDTKPKAPYVLLQSISALYYYRYWTSGSGTSFHTARYQWDEL